MVKTFSFSRGNKMQRDTVLVLIGLMAGGLISLFLGYFVNLTTPDLQQTILE